MNPISPSKATEPDGVAGRVLKHYTREQFSMTLINTFLEQATIPTRFRLATIIPVPKQLAIKSLNEL